MRNKRSFTFASYMLILAMLACTLPSGQSTDQPDLAATITALAQELQTTPSTTPAPGETLLPTDTPAVANTAPAANTPQQQPAQPAGPSTPSKPKDFKAQGSGTTIAFTWNDNATDENGFRIYQEGQSAPIASIDAHPSTGGMSYNWSGLSCAFSGKFFIRAFNNQGESDSSSSKDAVTVPCPPENLIATGSGNTINFNWAVSGGHNEEGFRIYQQGVAAPVASRGRNQGSGGTNYDMTGVPSNVVGTYSVTAFNNAGESPASNLFQAESVPCGPSNFTITGTTQDTVNYSWTDNATSETGFHIWQNDVLYATLPANNGTGTLSNDAFQICGKTIVYSVTAFNYAGDSTTSAHVGATTLNC